MVGKINTQMSNTKSLYKKECEKLLEKSQVSALELEALLKARQLGLVKFNLVDTREYTEWLSERIKGTDYLVPTTSFYQSLEQIESQRDTVTILYCHSGVRSVYCQAIMLSCNFKNVINFDYGIITYEGELVSGEK